MSKEATNQENEKAPESDILKERSEQHLEDCTKWTKCFVTGRHTLLTDVGKFNFKCLRISCFVPIGIPRRNAKITDDLASDNIPNPCRL